MEENSTSVVIEQQGENKKRGALAVILAIAFVAMLGIGTTFAYLTYVGNQTPNRFTTDKGLTVDLVEPAWTNALTTQSNHKWPNVASDGKTEIPEAANNMKEGSVVKKDPYIINTSKASNGDSGATNETAFVGMRLTFQKWVATENNGKDAAAHKETGSYVNMTQKEVEALLNVYSFSSEDAGGSTAGFNKEELSTANWVKTSSLGADESADVNTVASDGQMYFTYKLPLSPLSVDDPDNATAADYTPDPAGNSTTANLFKSVKLVKYDGSTASGAAEDGLDEDGYQKAYNNFLDYLKKGEYKGTKQDEDGNEVEQWGDNATTDPGWRVICSSVAVSNQPWADSSADEISEADFTTIGKALVDSYTDVNTKVDGSTTGVNAPTGIRAGKSNVTIPEARWTD